MLAGLALRHRFPQIRIGNQVIPGNKILRQQKTRFAGSRKAAILKSSLFAAGAIRVEFDLREAIRDVCRHAN
jgi:hypothetical protein